MRQKQPPIGGEALEHNRLKGELEKENKSAAEFNNASETEEGQKGEPHVIVTTSGREVYLRLGMSLGVRGLVRHDVGGICMEAGCGGGMSVWQHFEVVSIFFSLAR